ncbi:MAG: helix-hairpin-helix domain-containing protein, partial [Alistipes sp.]|nr:helix-hairpin-helix domain-containing protein [Alistipes sp.]
EAHRFGITFHRQKRSNDFIHSELELIEGIGVKTISTLLKHFRTVSKVKAAPLEELSALIGPAKAKKVKCYFSEENTPR